MISKRTAHRLRWGVALLLTAAAALEATAEPFMVWGPRADLYQEKRLVAALSRGDLVEGVVSQQDAAWLAVEHAQQKYYARRRDFRTRLEAERELRRTLAGAENQLAGTEADINNTLAVRRQLYESLIQLARDQMVTFLVPNVQVTSGPVATSPGSQTGLPGPVLMPTVSTRPEHIEKLSKSKAKRLERDFRERLAAAEKQLQVSRQSRRKQQEQVIGVELQLQQVLERFDRFSKDTGSDYRLELLQVGPKGGVLYQESVKKALVPAGEFVYGVANRRHPGWAQVRYQGQIYDGQRTEFVSEAELHQRFAGQLAEIGEQAATLEAELDLLRHRQTLLQTWSLRVQTEAESEGVRAVVKDIDHHWRLRNKLDPDGPFGVVEVLDHSDARRQLRDWEEELGQVTEALQTRRRQLGDVRQKEVDLELRYTELKRRLAAVAPPDTR